MKTEEIYGLNTFFDKGGLRHCGRNYGVKSRKVVELGQEQNGKVDEKVVCCCKNYACLVAYE